MKKPDPFENSKQPKPFIRVLEDRVERLKAELEIAENDLAEAIAERNFEKSSGANAGDR